MVDHSFDHASYYVQVYRAGTEGDGRFSPLLIPAAATKFNGNMALLSSQAGQSPQEGNKGDKYKSKVCALLILGMIFTRWFAEALMVDHTARREDECNRKQASVRFIEGGDSQSKPHGQFLWVVGTPLFSLGTDISYDTASGNLTKWNAGVSFTNADMIGSLFSFVDVCVIFNASYWHIDSPMTYTDVGAKLSHSFSTNENTLTIGTKKALDQLTYVKARINNHDTQIHHYEVSAQLGSWEF
ncbi:hypothetical protein C5167_029239 [Papaver somniferum]|nr:hypothetical protein C5167_029239 [Papaver somniferum]